MSIEAPCLGIDFGTSKSCMAWYNPRTGQSELLRNAEGEEQTPSVVYFGPNQILVGKPAVNVMLDDPAQRERIVVGVKRDMATSTVLALPDRRIRPVEVAALILGKLRRDAEDLHFHQPVPRAVITCPAAFDAVQRDKIQEAALLAGFTEVVLLEEPVAAALAYARTETAIGSQIMVYDLGAGTFDLALVCREARDTFRVVLEPQGIAGCGGHDFDLQLYSYCDKLAWRTLGHAISPGGMDVRFLTECKHRKELLSAHERCQFSSYLHVGGEVFKRFQPSIERTAFEQLIAPTLQHTIDLTRAMIEQGAALSVTPDTLVLIGGSSRIPLIARRLEEALGLRPVRFDKAEVAVTLGAAFYTAQAWPPADDTPAQDNANQRPGADVRAAVRLGAVRVITWLEQQRVTLDATVSRAAETHIPAALSRVQAESRRFAAAIDKQSWAIGAAVGTAIDNRLPTDVQARLQQGVTRHQWVALCVLLAAALVFFALSVAF